MVGSGFAEMPQMPFAPSQALRGSTARFEPDNRRRLSAPALRTFAGHRRSVGPQRGAAAAGAGLSVALDLSQLDASWPASSADVTLDVDALTRLSAVFGIHQALGVLFGDAGGRAWRGCTGPHDAPLFGGQPPLALVTAGTLDGLLLVRRFLDAARGGLYMAPNGDRCGAGAQLRDSDIVFR